MSCLAILHKRLIEIINEDTVFENKSFKKNEDVLKKIIEPLTTVIVANTLNSLIEIIVRVYRLF